VPVAGRGPVRLLRVAQPTVSATAKRRELLKLKITALFDASDGTFDGVFTPRYWFLATKLNPLWRQHRGCSTYAIA
jgi:hypothetical protein